MSPVSPSSYVLVAGLGRSGLAMARFLKARGYMVVATDSNPDLERLVPELHAQGIVTEIGPHNMATFENARLIIASPGIPLSIPCLERAAQKGVPIRGELDVAAEHITAPIVAVTGTNGKTTVTSLIDCMAKTCHARVFTGGNIGTPLAAFFEQETPADLVVAEVSSFQLDTARGFKPHVAVLLNITPDHMDRYPSDAAYRTAKWRIFEHQTSADAAIIGSSLIHCTRELSRLHSTCYMIRHSPDAPPKNGALIQKDEIVFYENGVKAPRTLRLAGISLKGKHNLENLAAAALAARLTGTDTAAAEEAARHFKGLAHRMVHAGTVDGIKFYNDSKATNPDAVIKALSCFGQVVLIMGGQAKNTDFSPLIPHVARQVSHLIVMGAAKEEIRNTLAGSCPITEVETMAQAVAAARNLAGPEEPVLFSPACASFDMYRSYGHRGDDFTAKVNRLT